ncbi:MAG: hypothetical protein GY866_10550, partial [Proteobacteria bacterium]|nr:hypothetical protein [Pseudomonadota bacterium]
VPWDRAWSTTTWSASTAALESILQAREKCVLFENLLDVFAQIDTSKVNSRVLEALVKSGAFDSLEPNRQKILEGIDRILSLAQAEKSMHRENQVSFFDLLSEEEEEEEKSRTKVELPDVADWKSKNRLKFEKEALGFSDTPPKPPRAGSPGRKRTDQGNTSPQEVCQLSSEYGEKPEIRKLSKDSP